MNTKLLATEQAPEQKNQPVVAPVDAAQYRASLASQRDVKIEAARAMVQSETFDPESEAYKMLKQEAKALAGKIGELDGIIEAQRESRAMDDRAAPRTEPGRPSGWSVTREQDVYRRDGDRSFFGDLFRATLMRESSALEHLDRHRRALTTSAATNGAGAVVPPAYVAALFADNPKENAPVAMSWPQYPLGDARPFQVPRVKTPTAVGVQATENTAPAETDMTFDQLTVTPQTLTGAQTFSRQLLDGSSPAIDLIVGSDLAGELYDTIEGQACTKLLATAGAQTGTSTGAGEDLIDAIRAAIVQSYGGRKRPADVAYVSVATYAVLITAKDLSGRPLLNAYNPQNAFGTGDTRILQTQIDGVPVIASSTLTADRAVVARSADFGLFRSPEYAFRFEEKSGPQSIQVGVWQYVASMTERWPAGVVIITHTPAVGATAAAASHRK